MTLARRIWRIVNLMALILAILSLRIVYWQLVRGPELQPVVLDPVAAAAQYREANPGENPDLTAPVSLDALPQPVIQRTRAMLAQITRGTIYDRNGRALAYDYRTADSRKARFYAEPSMAPVVGYVSGLGIGVSGIEYSLNETLLGVHRLDNQLGQMIHQPIVGSDIHLTLDSRLQRAAVQALGSRTGAVVVLDGHTGAVLARASTPAFDPNRILNEDYVQALFAGCSDAATCQNALLNRATQGLYVPGSTWKTVTLIAALDTGRVTPQTIFDVGPPRRDDRGNYYVYEVDGGIIIDRNHTEQVLNLERSYVTSANAVFARLGDEMGAETFLEYAARLGFSRANGEAPPLEIATSAAQVANDPEALRHNNLLRAATAVGQGELLTSPLSMALVVAAVVNEGDIPRPHLVQAIRHPADYPLQGEPSGNWVSGVMRPETAQQVRQMMIALVKSGSAAAVPGLTIGGKTGTAEVSGGLGPHAWFIGFAEGEARTVAIAV
ncbi:MAG TPA: penicillin-binding protein 2, partial [Anaerolineae bacterium]|nr:penicillin-binding protein 2 [Anaerolineae bacterium]